MWVRFKVWFRDMHNVKSLTERMAEEQRKVHNVVRFRVRFRDMHNVKSLTERMAEEQMKVSETMAEGM